MKSVVIVCLLLLHVQRAASQRTSDWLAASYDHYRCDRPEHVRLIYICNPDGVLPESDVQALETAIELIKNETNSSCTIEGTAPRGYTIRALILTKYNETLLPMPRDHKLKHGERMKSFAKFLHESLTPDSELCDDGILILTSVEDKKIQSVVGEAVRLALAKDKQNAIDKEAENYLAKGKVTDAVQFLLDEYGSVLRGGQSSVLVEADKTMIIAAAVAGVLIIVLLVLALIVFRWLRGLKPNECVDGAATNTTEGPSQSEQSEEKEPSESVKL